MIKTYTQDFFDRAIPDLDKVLEEFKGKGNLKFLEIGSYEGRSTSWFMDKILTDKSSTIHCLDLWEGSGKQGAWAKEIYDKYIMDNIYSTFLANTAEYGNRVTHEVGISQLALRKMPTDPESCFDFIYVDGSHIASDVLEDGILSFRLLKPNGIMGFDDYAWDYFGDPRRHPGMAIDAILSIYEGKYELLHKGYQVFVRKTAQGLHVI
jgi:predicted O-methyltransferase YrrM